MKKTIGRALALALALLMLCAAFASCDAGKKAEKDDTDTDSSDVVSDVTEESEDSEKPEETEETVESEETAETEDTEVTEGAEDTEEIDIYEDVRDINFGGRNFKILTYEAGVGWNPYITQVDEGALVLNNAVVKRNNMVETLLNIQIDTFSVEQKKLVEHVYLTSTSNYVDYDLIFSYATNTFDSLLPKGILYNVKKVDYMDLDAAWYNQSANQSFTIKNKQYFFVSDFSLPVQQRFAFLANLDMIEEYGALDHFEDVDTIYDLVKQGQWNIDNMQIMIKNVTSPEMHGDFNGTFGFVTNENSASRFLNNWGEDIVSTEYIASLDTSRFVFNLNGAILDSKVSRLTSFVHDDINVYFEPLYDPTNQYGHSKNDPDSGNPNDYYEIFKRQDAMFATFSSDPWLLATGAEYQDMHFAYLPYPKYTDQEDYITVTHGGVMMFSGASTDISFSGAVTEALSAASYEYMVDAYKKNYFEGRVIQDVEGIDMYQIILDTAYYDVARYIDPTGSDGAASLCRALGYFGFLSRSGQTLDWRFGQHGTTITTAYTNLYVQLPEE